MRLVGRDTITDTPRYFQTAALGYDNTEMLPPFVPTYRNSDSLFGVIVRECFKQLYFAHLPSAVRHSPTEFREYPPQNFIGQHPSMVDLMVACISICDPISLPESNIDSLKVLGKRLSDLASMAQDEFDEIVRAQINKASESRVAMLDHYLSVYGYAPWYWAYDMMRLIESLKGTASRRDYIVPEELVHLDKNCARQKTKATVFEFGRLLYWWPEIQKATKRLRVQGSRVSLAC